MHTDINQCVSVGGCTNQGLESVIYSLINRLNQIERAMGPSNSPYSQPSSLFQTAVELLYY